MKSTAVAEECFLVVNKYECMWKYYLFWALLITGW